MRCFNRNSVGESKIMRKETRSDMDLVLNYKFVCNIKFY